MTRLKRPFTQEESDYIKDNWGKIRLNDISLELKRNKSSIYYHAKDLGLSGKNGPIRRKTRYPNYRFENKTPKTHIKALLARPVWFDEYEFEKKLTAGR